MCLVLLFPVFRAVRPPTLNGQTDGQAEVAASIRSFGEAWSKNDIPTLERLLAPEYIHTDVNGDVFTRARWLEYIKQKKNAQAVNDITFHDVHIQVAGSVAWVTGENVFSGPAYATEKGAPGTRKLRFTQIWVKRDGTWQRAAFQATWETSAAAGR
jgi:ketosteroid isomerase-like protein